MRETLGALAATVAFVVPMTSTAVPASAGTARDIALPTSAEVTSIYPEMENEEPIRGRWGVSAHDFDRVDGRLRCDRYRDFRGVENRSALFSRNVTNLTLLDVSVYVLRFRTAADAETLVRQYRSFARTCRGTHNTTDGEGGKAKMKVRTWSPASIGDSSTGLLDAFIQSGDTVWRRTIASRVARTVTVVEVAPPKGTGSRSRAIAMTRLAVAKATATS